MAFLYPWFLPLTERGSVEGIGDTLVLAAWSWHLGLNDPSALPPVEFDEGEEGRV